MEGLLRRLLWLREHRPDEKALVFSQFREALVMVGKVGLGGREGGLPLSPPAAVTGYAGYR